MTQEWNGAAGVAIVTGAASGMGQAAARLLAEAGASLLLCDLNGERLAQTAAQLPGNPETLAADLSAPGFCDTLIAALADRPIAAVIHCAGLSPTLEARPERILEVNLAATLRLVEAIRPRMAEGAAAVLFASSAAHQVGDALDGQIGAVTTPEQVPELLPLSPNSGIAYMVSKRGVYLLVRREAKGFGARGARIVSISPGVIDTPMGRSEMEQQPIMKLMVENSALPRPARAEEVASVAAFLCSPAASFVTGTDVLVDGGCLATPLPALAGAG